MRGYLLDTNVLSEYNRAGSPNPGIVRWIETTHEDMQYISVLTLAEIEKGVLRMEDGKRRRELERWFDQIKNYGHSLPGVFFRSTGT